MRYGNRIVVFLICAALILCIAGIALAEPVVKYVPQGAFGESYDELGKSEQALCAQYATDALAQLRQQVHEGQFDASVYAEVLQTTVYLIDEAQPAGLSEFEQEAWEKYYQDKMAIVSFTGLENYFDEAGKPMMPYAARQRDYAAKRDGTWEEFSLQKVFSRIYANPVFPGMRTINMGSYCNGVYTTESTGE